MNSLEEQMLNLLKDLKENHGVVCLKAEFEQEGTTFDEALRLKELADKSGLSLAIKLGGCAALNDMHFAKQIEADEVIAPMIESPYAAQKFLNMAKRVFDNKTKLFIDIETKYALNFLSEILSADFEGVVLGRTDLTGSFGADSNDVNNDMILQIAKDVSLSVAAKGKKFTVGGGINAASIPFFKELPYITRFETRKVIFNADTALKERTEEGILKAVDFELMWLKNNQENYNEQSNEYKHRIEVLKSRFGS